MAKKKRVRKDSPPVTFLHGWKQADDYVRRLGDQQNQIEQHQATAKKCIDMIKAELQTKVSKIQKTIDYDALVLQAFCGSHLKDFKKNRSKKLQFGRVGWRKSTSVKTTNSTLDLIKKLLSAAKRKECIIVKESVDKNALAKLTDEQLVSIEAQRKEKDVFFVEPSIPEAADYKESAP